MNSPTLPSRRSLRGRIAVAASLASCFALVSAVAQETATPEPGEQIETSLKVSDSLAMPYLLALPEDYGKDPDKRWPVMVFLHGRGESNGPLSVVAKWGPPRFAAKGEALPYILISPQCPRETNWNDLAQQAGILAILDKTLKDFAADDRRVYLTGLSMGGYGSWSLAARHPERFAAVAPVCGGGDPADAEVLAKLPIWTFHGTEDGPVPFEKSVAMVEAIKKAGGEKIRFTSLEHFGHNTWSAAYASPELYKWLDRHSLEK